MRACLSFAGNTPFFMERLHRWQMVGAMTDARCLSSQVGTGSSSHDLAGVVFSSLTTSVMVVGSKQLRGVTCRAAMTDESADVLDSRMDSTFSLKNRANCSAESLSE